MKILFYKYQVPRVLGDARRIGGREDEKLFIRTALIHSRNITWLNQSYATYKNLDSAQIVHVDSMDLVDISDVPEATTIPLGTDPALAPITPVPATTPPTPASTSTSTSSLISTAVATVPSISDVSDDDDQTSTTGTTVATSRVIRKLNRLGTTLDNVAISEHRYLRSGRDDDINLLPDSPKHIDVGYVFSDFRLLV